MILRLLIILVFIGTAPAQLPEKDLAFYCGNNEFTEIPAQAQHFVEMGGERNQQYNIGLAFQIIYGEYALTDITLHLTINEYYENAGILLYDMFTKHWLMDDWVSFTEANQTMELTFNEKAGPHYLRIYSPHESGAVAGYITDADNNILISWSEEDFLQWQSETTYNSVYINFDTGIGDFPVGKTPADEIERAVNRLNYRHNNSPFYFQIDTINYTHNNSWAIGEDMWNTWESVYTLSYNSLESLNIFSIIGFYYNLGLGGVGLFPWTIDDGDPIFYRVSMKGVYLTDLTAEEGRDHVFDHEVGHSLGLLHTFNYGCDLDTHGDYVQDTPTHAYANNVCDYTVDSCPDDPGNDPVDNVMNYVYGSECQMGFTVGQHDRSLWAINTWVPTLIDTVTTVISVPEDFITIQEALDSADVGYTIHVSPGTYFENIQWPNIDKLKLIGSGPDSTLIDGNQNGRVIKVGDGASPPSEISGFTITNGNTGGRGGGIQIKMTGDILLSNLVISNNQANSGGGIIVEGIGGAWNGEAHVSVENVVFSGNHATGNGGGYTIYDDYVSTLFKSVTFANNSADGSGGGMRIYGMSHYAVLANSTLWNNSPDDVSGTVFPHYSNLNGGVGGEGNFIADPLFMDSTDFHLQEESPCIDAGSALVIINLDSLMLPGEDWMGDTIVNVNPAYYGGNSPDMGAYESPFTGPFSGPVWHVSTTGSDSMGDGSEENPFASIQFGLDLASEGDTVSVSNGMYLENIIWPATNGIQLIGSGEENCVIDGDSTGRVITFHDSSNVNIDTTTHITGFTIQNGVSDLENITEKPGAGIYCVNASPMLTDCTIKENYAYGDGGGIALLDSSDMIIANVKFQDNMARGWRTPGQWPRYRGKGGGIFIVNSDPVLTNVEITDNYAGKYGGGVYLLYSSASFTHFTISGNIGSGILQKGGGVFCESTPNATFTEGIIVDNVGPYLGGGIAVSPAMYDSSSFHVELTNVLIQNNTSRQWGGGIYGSYMSLSGCTIKGNTAESQGGGIYSEGGIFFSSNDRCNIYENTIEDSIDVGNDIAISVDYYGIPQSFMDVILDTFTVLTPTDYYATPIDSFSFDILNGLETVKVDDEMLPTQFALHPPYPNPFNPTTTLRFNIPSNTTKPVLINIYDITGSVVETVINEKIESGHHEIQWNVTASSSGVYFVELRIGEKRLVQKLLYIK